MKFSELKTKINIVDIIGGMISGGLRKRGAEHVGMCPFHGDRKPSLNVNEKKQLFFCGPCGAKGDVVDFLLQWGMDYTEAAKYLEDQSGQIGPANQREAKSKKIDRKEWEQIIPAPKAGQIIHYKYGAPTKKWVYRNLDGSRMGYICRFDIPGQGKEIAPYTFCTDGRIKQWRWQGFSYPRPLYNLHLINRNPKKTIVLFEGEKAADAGQELFPHVVCSTWQGGSNGIGAADLSPLTGRTILLWPDNDKGQRYGDKHPKKGQIRPWEEQPGNAAMLGIYQKVKGKVKGIKWVENKDHLPDKWDIADANWTAEEALIYARENVVDVEEILARKRNEESVNVDHPGPASVPDAPKEKKRGDGYLNDDVKHYFRFLGYEKTEGGINIAFYVRESRTIHVYSPGRLARTSTLITLAPLDFWEAHFSGGRSKKIDLDMVLNWMVRISMEEGFFSSDLVRGRGAWIDQGKVVIHAGNELIVNGQPIPLASFPSRYVYEAGPSLGYRPGTQPLKKEEAYHLISACKLLNWERPVNAQLLAGWCVVASVCGALYWRPHIWLTGSAGSGKSWVMEHIVRQMLGRAALAVQSETTEPGIRQLLQSDALAVVFDEAEAEDFRAHQRMKQILALMRAASANDGGILAKGGTGGHGATYQIRSCFGFASIGVAATQQSDRSRITILSLLPADKKDQESQHKWEELQRIQKEVFTDEYSERLRARTIRLLPVILQNCKVFAEAVAQFLGEQRVGDQLGTILAGAYSLTSERVVSLEAAMDIVKGQDWTEEKSLDQSKDEVRLLSFLMEHIIKVMSGRGFVERTVSELVFIAAGLHLDDGGYVSKDMAEEHLQRSGFRVRGDELYISNNSRQILKILERTPWAANHGKILGRVANSQVVPSFRFGPGISSRAVCIPLTNLIPDWDIEELREAIRQKEEALKSESILQSAPPSPEEKIISEPSTIETNVNEDKIPF